MVGNFLQYLRQVINYIITNVEAQIFLLVAGTVKKQTIFNIYYGQIADMQETKVSITGILDYIFRFGSPLNQQSCRIAKDNKLVIIVSPSPVSSVFFLCTKFTFVHICVQKV